MEVSIRKPVEREAARRQEIRRAGILIVAIFAADQYFALGMS